MSPRNPTCWQRALRGMTLIEMLSVIALFAMVMVVVTANFWGTDSGAELMKAAAKVREFDARARLQARTLGEPVVMSFDKELRLLKIAQCFGHEIARQQLNADASFELIGSAHISAILFDRCGHSLDYRVKIKQHGNQMALNVSGASGLVTQEAVQ